MVSLKSNFLEGSPSLLLTQARSLLILNLNNNDRQEKVEKEAKEESLAQENLKRLPSHDRREPGSR
jgi:hypothetical protein